MTSDVQRIVDELLDRYPESDIRKAIAKSAKRRGERVLTVVVNFGMHSLPEEILRGDVLFFSEGNVDLSDEGIHRTMMELSKRAVRFLRSKVWQKIYIVPSGHPALVVLATLVTYRVTRVDPSIVYYLDGKYNDVDFDIRSETVKKNTLL
ncbi:hypothetical protein [Sphingobium sp.]|uniref:hypothetical protein n=1 Tax=Sphingobium sp. TaxID=1912891 RepID=UPI0035C68246